MQPLRLPSVSRFPFSRPAIRSAQSAIYQILFCIDPRHRLILLGWGVVQVGLSFQSHDPSQRSQGFLTLAGGLVVTFAKEILDLITAAELRDPAGRDAMNWVIDNLNSALGTWNDKLTEIWALLTQDPATFKGAGSGT